MPTYEFTCKQCGKDFTLTITFSAYDKKGFTCPKCGSKEVTQQITAFQTKTSKKSCTVNAMKCLGLPWYAS